MEPGGVVHLREVGQLVADDVVAQLLGEEDQHVAQGYAAPERAVAQGAEASRDGPPRRVASDAGGQLAGAGEKDLGGYLAGHAAEQRAGQAGGGLVIEVEVCTDFQRAGRE